MTQHQIICHQLTPSNSPFARITKIRFLLAQGSAGRVCLQVSALMFPTDRLPSAWSLSFVPLQPWPLLTGEHEQQEQRQVPQAAEEQLP